MTSCAQRLWLLERIGTSSTSERQDVCGFTGAIAILWGGATYVAFIRSARAAGATEARLLDPGLRLNVERDGRKFTTLDDAMAWAESMKRRWLCDGWTEVEEEPSLRPAPDRTHS